MATLTREQYNKWNAQAFNGFTLDVEYFIIWGEKTLHKIIDLEDGKKAEIKVEYFPEFETITNEHGCTYNRRTGRHVPEIIINSLTPTSSGCYVVIEKHKEERPERVQAKKNFKTLCEITKDIDANEIVNKFFKEV